ncbi:TPA: NUMOD3 domain-containing DNA-binding protein [Escherichia coli]
MTGENHTFLGDKHSSQSRRCMR